MKNTGNNLKIFLIAFIVVLTGLANAADNQSTNKAAAEDVMKQIQRAYTRVTALRSTFRQTVSQVAFGRSYQADGQIRYAAGKLRWDYNAPTPQTYVVADGFVYWMQPSERQVVQMALGQAFESHHAVASLLGGMSELHKHFKPEKLSEKDQISTLTVTPKFENPQVAVVRIVFDRIANTVVGIEIDDAFGNINKIELLDVNKAATVDQKIFTETVPKGYILKTFGS